MEAIISGATRPPVGRLTGLRPGRTTRPRASRGIWRFYSPFWRNSQSLYPAYRAVVLDEWLAESSIHYAMLLKAQLWTA